MNRFFQNSHTGKKNWIQTAFPVPTILTVSHTSIDISDGVLRFFEGSQKHGILSPKDFGTIPLPRMHGEENSEKARAETISVLKKWMEGRKNTPIHVIIHEDEVYVFKVTVPTTTPKEIYSALEALLEENVPIPPGDALFEYSVIGSDEILKETTVAVSVVSKKAAQNHLSLFRESGIQVASLETESRSLAKALCAPHDTEVHAVLAIKERHSIVCIIEKSSVVFSSSIEVGQNDIERAVAKTYNLTEEATKTYIKEKIAESVETDTKLFEAMMPVFGTLRDELGKMLIYWKTQGKKERDFKDVSDVILLGSSVLTTGFSQYIASASKIPARIGSVWTNTLSPDTSLPHLHKEESLNYASLIGTLL